MPREVPLGRRVVVLVGLVGLGDLAERREHVVLLGPGSWSGALERGVSLNGQDVAVNDHKRGRTMEQAASEPGELVRSMLESLNSDIDFFYENLADDVIYEPFGIEGRDAVRSLEQPFLDAFASHHRVVERLMQDGDRVYVWLRFTGTTRTGEIVELDYNNHYLVRDGKVAVMSNFTDTSAVAEIIPRLMGS